MDLVCFRYSVKLLPFNDLLPSRLRNHRTPKKPSSTGKYLLSGVVKYQSGFSRSFKLQSFSICREHTPEIEETSGVHGGRRVNRLLLS